MVTCPCTRHPVHGNLSKYHASCPSQAFQLPSILPMSVFLCSTPPNPCRLFQVTAFCLCIPFRTSSSEKRMPFPLRVLQGPHFPSACAHTISPLSNIRRDLSAGITPSCLWTCNTCPSYVHRVNGQLKNIYFFVAGTTCTLLTSATSFPATWA